MLPRTTLPVPLVSRTPLADEPPTSVRGTGMSLQHGSLQSRRPLAGGLVVLLRSRWGYSLSRAPLGETAAVGKHARAQAGRGGEAKYVTAVTRVLAETGRKADVAATMASQQSQSMYNFIEKYGLIYSSEKINN